MLITKQIKVIYQKKFTVIAVNTNNKTFIIYKNLSKANNYINIFYLLNPSCFTNNYRNFIKYSNFFNIFFSNSITKLLEYNKVINHFTYLLNYKKLFYSLIYSLGLVELEILKIYIQANLDNSFITSSKSFANTLILFIQEKNNSFYVYINY